MATTLRVVGARGAWLLTGTIGCAEFPALEVGECGNRIVEPGEDCDEPDNRRCGKITEGYRACRVLCDPTVADTDKVCEKDGFVCGSDSICRLPSRTFSEDRLELPLAGIASIAFGDLDGDASDDLVIQLDAAGVRGLFLDNGTLVDYRLHDVPPTTIAVGDLSGDGAAEVLLAPESSARGRGVSLWQIPDPATEAPTGRRFATLRTVGTQGRLLAPTPDADRILELGSDGLTRHWSSHTAAAQDVPSMRVDGSSLGRAVAVADLDGGWCDSSSVFGRFPRAEIALGSVNDGRVELRSTCADGLEVDELPPVLLGGGRTLGDAGVFFALVNGDDRLDLVAQTRSGAVVVSYGVGDGTFHDDAMTPSSDGNGRFASAALLAPGNEPPGMLLAIADLDDDAEPELVTSTYYLPDPRGCPADCERVPWPAEADYGAVMDFNGDGSLDVATLSAGELYVHLGAPLRPVHFESHRRPLSGPAQDLVVGDFNRDTIQDVAFVEQVGAEPPDTRVTVYYGGAIDAWRPERFGPFHAIETLIVEEGAAIVARVVDSQGRFGGAFVRPGEPEHQLGFEARRPETVRTESGFAVVMVAKRGDAPPTLAHLGFTDGRLSPHDITFSDGLQLPTGTETYGVLQAVDLVRSPDEPKTEPSPDELVLLTTGANGGEVHVASLDTATGAWLAGPPLLVGPGFARQPPGGSLTTPGGGPGSSVAVGDADADGDLDLLATTDEPIPRVVLLRNEGGAFGADSVIFVDVNPSANINFEVHRLSNWHADRDGLGTWLVGGPAGPGLATVDVDAAELDIEIINRLEGHELAAADIDGDGLMDLVYATEHELLVYPANEEVGGMTAD